MVFRFNRSFCSLYPFVQSIFFIRVRLFWFFVGMHSSPHGYGTGERHKITVMPEPNMYHGILHDVLAWKKIPFILLLTPRKCFFDAFVEYNYGSQLLAVHNRTCRIQMKNRFYYRAKLGIRYTIIWPAHDIQHFDCMPSQCENTQNEMTHSLVFIHQFEFHWLLAIIIFVQCQIIIMVSFSILPQCYQRSMMSKEEKTIWYQLQITMNSVERDNLFGFSDKFVIPKDSNLLPHFSVSIF